MQWHFVHCARDAKELNMIKQRSDIFLGRQPIVDRRQNVVAYELLYRASRNNIAEVDDAAASSAAVMHRAFKRLGITTVLGPCAGFVNVDAELLASRRIESLPPEQVVVELLETIVVDSAVIDRCRELKARGYRLALDDVIDCRPASKPLLEIADIVKIDVPQLDHDALAALVARLRIYPGRLLAEKVESRERARECLALGFELFQGFFFAPTRVLAT